MVLIIAKMAKSNLPYSDVHIDVKAPNGKRIKKPVRFVNTGILLFFNAQHHLVELPTVAISFYVYVCEQMNWKNEITLDMGLKAGYVDFINKHVSKKNISSPLSLDRYIKKLKELALIIPLGSPRSAHYLVNPKYAFRGNETARKALLQRIIERRIANGESIQGLVDEEEASFLS